MTTPENLVPISDAEPSVAQSIKLMQDRMFGAAAIWLLQRHQPYNEDIDWAMAHCRGTLDIFSKMPTLSGSAQATINVINVADCLADMGVGSIKVSNTREDVADSIDRQVDSLSGYLISHDLIDEVTNETLQKFGSNLLERFATNKTE